MNRAERRRRGLTRSRMARTGSLASAGVLMSVGLFGAYTGSPRLQRAYAGSCPDSATPVAVVNELALGNALINPYVTCIRIDANISLTSPLPVIGPNEWDHQRLTQGLTIFGDPTAPGGVILDGNDHTGIQLSFYNDTNRGTDAVHLSVSDLTLTDFTSPQGGGIYAFLQGTPRDLVMSLDRLIMSDNLTVGLGNYAAAGGAAYAFSNMSNVYMTVTDSLFQRNQAARGGGLYARGDDTTVVTLASSTFRDNVATSVGSTPGRGGAVYVNSSLTSSLISTQDLASTPASIFEGNTSSDEGGAIVVTSSETTRVDIARVQMRQNNAGGSGGAVYAGSTTYGNRESSTFVEVTDSTFTGNTGENFGGALAVMADDDTAVLDVRTSTFSVNEVTLPAGPDYSYGGAIAVKTKEPLGYSKATVGAGSTFSYNTSTAPAWSYGGAIYAADHLEIIGQVGNPVKFHHNSANGGGAVFLNGDGTIEYAEFYDNTATGGNGGAINDYIVGTTLALSNVSIENNSAVGLGGGISSSGHVTLERSSVVGNSSGGDGGGVQANSSVTISNTFIGQNSTARLGGAVATYNGVGDVHLSFSTLYDDTAAIGATEIWAGNITSTMSVVGSGTSSDVWEFTGTLDDTSSVSTADDTYFSINLSPGQLKLGNLTGDAPDEVGRTPNADSPLSVAAGIPGGYAPLVNPLPGITTDQRGFARVAPFTIGARQALTINSVTPSSGESTGGELVTIHGSAFTGTTSAAIGNSAITNLTVVDDTTITGIAPAGTVGDADVTVTDASSTATLADGFTYFTPTPNPNPPAPTPEAPASAPRDVRAEAAVESAHVTWLPPASTGSFPVTSYQAVASPGGQTCMVAAPALTCTITGLTPGKPYTVTARALTGAGWSEASSPSSVVVPLGPEVPTILITNSRDRAQKSMARIEGTTTGLVGAEVVPYLRMAGQTDFTPGASTRTVDADGNFIWQRKAKKRFTVYFVSGDVTSNRLVIRPE